MIGLDQMNYWKLLAGLGIFLFGMFFLEKALKKLIGRNFKKFLRNNTEQPLKALIGGTVATILLQSSSVILLMLLAFVGSGIIKLRSAVSIIFGANLGSTFTGWLFVLLGFNLGIENFAFFFIAFGSLSMMMFSKVEKIYQVGSFLLGFGFLFLGLEFMKTSIGSLNNLIDLEDLIGLSWIVFFICGFIITAIIHSSSAMMVIVLSGLYAGIIPLESAAIMIIGSDLGTTMTVVVGAIKGSPVKKRVALCHVLFNTLTATMAFILLYPLLLFFESVLHITDPLYTLVLFHSCFNLVGVLVLFPFMAKITRFLESRFNRENLQITHYIQTVPTTIPELALDALGQEIDAMIEQVIQLNVTALKIRHDNFSFSNPLRVKKNGIFGGDNYAENYAALKQLEGKIVEYYLGIQRENLKEEELNLLNRYIYSVRDSMISAKALKGVEQNIRDFENSSNDAKRNLFHFLRDQQREFYLSFHLVFKKDEKLSYVDQLNQLIKRNQEMYELFLKEVYLEIEKKSLTDIEISTLLNVNRETYNANRALVLSIKEVILNEEETNKFNAGLE